MDANNEPPIETLTRDAPQLVSLLKEMKDGLDAVRSKVQALILKVKENQLLTADGMSYLETKHLLLSSYCQSIVYYLLRKAKGLSIGGHPVVRSLVEIRLFLEKIRPIDKKLEYQVQKLMKAAGNIGPEKEVGAKRKKKEESIDDEDPLKYRPNPDMLISKTSLAEQDGGVYRPPKFAPTTMDEENVDKMTKEEKHAKRWEKEQLRRYKRSSHLKEILDDFQDKPEEILLDLIAESFQGTEQAERRKRDWKKKISLVLLLQNERKKLERQLLKSGNGRSAEPKRRTSELRLSSPTPIQELLCAIVRDLKRRCTNLLRQGYSHDADPCKATVQPAGRIANSHLCKRDVMYGMTISFWVAL